MVKDDTILLLGAVGIGGYFLYKSDFFKGLSGVTSGAGQIAQDVGQVTGNIADFLNPLGATGTYLAQLLANEQTRSLRETQQAGLIDWDSFLKSRDSLVTQQATQEITKAEQKSLRVNDWEKTKTEVQDNATDVLTGFTQAGKSILFNPFSLLNVFSTGTLSNWITSKSLKTNKTTSSTSGAVTSFAASASSSTGNLGVSLRNIGSKLKSALNTAQTSSAQNQAPKVSILTGEKKKSIFDTIGTKRPIWY